MPVNFIPTATDYLRFLPEIIMTVVATLVMMLEPLTGQRPKYVLGNLSLLALVGAAFACFAADANPGPAFGGMVVVDGFATFFRVLVIAVGALTILGSYQYLTREEHNTGEYYALLLYSVVGQCVMVTANELIMLFIGLEISSIATYVMAGYLRDDKRGNEAALKYFLLGSFATAFLLYGVALVYGATGTTNLTEIRAAVMRPEGAPPVMLMSIAAALMFVGMAFKVSGAPFQMWAPDVYQGAPSPVAAFMSAGPKAAAFAIFLRVFLTIFEQIGDRWEPLVWLSALASMTIGNFAALQQTNIKRLMAYSSIAHAGYVLVAVTTRTEIGTAAAMFYLASYALMNVGAFAVISWLAGKGERHLQVDDFAGLGAKHPAAAAALSILLLSLIGVPLTGGFFGKFYIFQAAIQAKLIWLSVLGLLNSAVAAYYYLRILVVMYMRDPSDATQNAEPLSPALAVALWAPVVGILYLGIFPTGVLTFAVDSARLFGN